MTVGLILVVVDFASLTFVLFLSLGISGIIGAGKTTLAQELGKVLSTFIRGQFKIWSVVNSPWAYIQLSGPVSLVIL